jgi:glycosyltransferase involved in cell wall biosynthesis
VLAGLLLARGRWDLIYATSPPLFAGAAGLVLSYLRRTPLVFEARDIWPAAAVALGELRNPRAIRAAEWLEAACYRRARRIVTVTEGASSYLINHGVPDAKILLIPNGADTNRFYPQPAAGARLRRTLGLRDRFIVLFAGLHGLAQDLDTLLAVAQKLAHLTDVRFLFVGEGPEKAALVAQAQAWDLPNVLFHPEVDRDRVPAFLSMADLVAVPMRKADLLDTTIPLRVYDAWACGCPTLVAGSGEVSRLQDRARAGVTVTPGDARALVEALLHLRARPDLLTSMGANGARFVRAYRSRAVLGARLAGCLQQMIGS